MRPFYVPGCRDPVCISHGWHISVRTGHISGAPQPPVVHETPVDSAELDPSKGRPGAPSAIDPTQVEGMGTYYVYGVYLMKSLRQGWEVEGVHSNSQLRQLRLREVK